MRTGLNVRGSVRSKQDSLSFEVARIRKDFPILGQKVHGKLLVYLDNAATTQKPEVVISTLARYYSSENANIHRGIYTLSERATKLYEQVRSRVQAFLHVQYPSEIIFVRGATEGINLVAQSYGRELIQRGDEIVITAMEHHSNIVPWQVLCDQVGARLRVAPISDSGELILDEFEKLIGPKTKFVAATHVSNALGTVNPVKKMIDVAHRFHVPVLIDGAQSAPHGPVDVQDLDCDFFVCSGHKLFGPTGVGVLYGRRELLEAMPPYQTGGDMISSVSFAKTTYNVLPYKFEAGTPNIAGVIGLGAAIDYVQQIGLGRIRAYEGALLRYATEALSKIPRLKIIGTAREKLGVISFVLDGVHPHDIGTVLDQDGIAIRAGHHCAMPVMDRFGVPATARLSVAFYNTTEEIDSLVRSIYKVLEIFR